MRSYNIKLSEGGHDVQMKVARQPQIGVQREVSPLEIQGWGI